jgi:hypothetical protein
MAPLGRRVPIVDHHDHIFPKEGCHTSSTWVFFLLPIPVEGPRGHEIFHHVVVLEPVLDGVCVVWAGLLEESLEVV